MVASKTWRIRCASEPATYYIDSFTEPVECPTNSEHSISITEMDSNESIPDRLSLTMSTDYTISSTESTILFDTIQFSNSSQFTNSNGEITFNRDGDFEVSLSLTQEIKSGNSRTLVKIYIDHWNGSWGMIPGSKGYNMTHTSRDGKQTISKDVTLNVNSGDKIRIRCDKIRGSNVQYDYEGCMLQIKSIDE